MAEVMLQIGGHSYQVSCRDGEEPHLQTIAKLVDTKTNEARAAVGDMGEVRQLLLASLLLADEMIDMRKASPVQTSDAETLALERLADRVEAIVATLEKA
jgi:cell division protein ZapA